jgi:hypothetical protein
MRSQCNAVVNYVARVSYRPVTSYRQSCYMEAVQVPACPTACPTCPGPAPVAAAVVVPPAVAPATVTPAPPLNLPAEQPASPGLSEQRSLPPAGVNEQRQEYYPPLPPASRRSVPQPTVPVYKPERVASRTLSGATVNGQVVMNNGNTPRPGAQLVFLNSARQDVRTTADAAGRFQVNLASGNWYVYVTDPSGGLAYHNQLTVNPGDAGPLTVVSR